VDEVLLFLCVARTGSLTSAARELGQAPSTVGRRLDELERRLGAKLFERTPRGVTLTPAGTLYQSEVATIPGLLASAEERIQQFLSAPAGELRIVSPGGLWDFVADAAITYRRLYPDVLLELVQRSANLPSTLYSTELMVRASRRSPPPDRIQRKLGDLRMTLCAAPSWLERHGPVTAPSGILAHPCVVIGSSRESARIRLSGPSGVEVIRVPIGLFTSDPDVACRAAVAGLGPAGLPLRTCQVDLDSGALVRLLPEWELEQVPVLLLWKGDRQLPLRARLFVDLLVADLATDT
jgi:DNA-binding transcriptional LysR family regulator